MTKFYEALERAKEKQSKDIGKKASVPIVTLPTNSLPGTAEIDLESEMIELYQAILASLPDVGHRSILFMGSQSNEGTSTVARELARTVSLLMEKNVLLVDLDRSRPDLHVYANLKFDDDFTNMDAPIEKSLCQVDESSLYVMPLFHRTIASPRALYKAAQDNFWEPLKERFDLIIVDSPPKTGFSDGLAIVSQVDGVILVVEAEKTRWQVASDVADKIEKSGGRILGIVFNKRRCYIPQMIYRFL